MDRYVYVPNGMTGLNYISDVWTALRQGRVSMAMTSLEPEVHEGFDGYKITASGLLEKMGGLPRGTTTVDEVKVYPRIV